MNDKEKRDSEFHKNMAYDHDERLFKLENEFDEFKTDTIYEHVKRSKRDICLYACFFTGSILILAGQLINYLKG